ncbi:RarD protein [Longilinea arvoryzae]|uniref:RarD protein n=1 Tax=Longilinea arvoryzae TaxID=360412 RepID=A0A0S7BB94_9CHLR|nr:EamA family transporter RarD [Longilinea arvoryzae]GAP12477.1 RarD protein [Longilinea arvoryzae]
MKNGIGSAALAYALWGLIPIYFKAIQTVPADQILAHRFVWSFLFLILLVILRRDWPALRASLTLRTFLIYLGAGLLLAINWGLFVWAVNNGHVLEASLGYFINPLVNVVLGVVFLRERLRPLQWIPVALASAGVLYLTISFGRLPWIALGLAFSFGLYGLVKKLAPLGPLPGLTLETGSLFVVALGYLIAVEIHGAGSFGHTTPQLSLLVALSGIVTAVPLLLFAIGARRVSLTTLGLLQYTSPTLQFLTGIFLYHETFTAERLIGFCAIWLALILFSAESLITARRTMAASPLPAD